MYIINYNPVPGIQNPRMSWSTLPEAIFVFFFFCLFGLLVCFRLNFTSRAVQFKDRGDIEREGLSGNQQRNYFFVIDKTAL